jgi:hypothetical protein
MRFDNFSSSEEEDRWFRFALWFTTPSSEEMKKQVQQLSGLADLLLLLGFTTISSSDDAEEDS